MVTNLINIYTLYAVSSLTSYEDNILYSVVYTVPSPS